MIRATGEPWPSARKPTQSHEHVAGSARTWKTDPGGQLLKGHAVSRPERPQGQPPRTSYTRVVTDTTAATEAAGRAP